MALITRLARLWRADINALLDRLEAPDLVLTQSVREMEQALDADRHALARMHGEIERLASRESSLGDLLSQTDSALEDCLEADRDDLARPLLRRRLETERQVQQLVQRRGELTEETQRLAQRVSERKTSLADLRAEAAFHTEPQTRSETPSAGLRTAVIRDDEVEIQLLQAKRRRGGAA